MISFLLRVTCVICERAISTDVWQAMVARAIESQENSSEPLNRSLFNQLCRHVNPVWKYSRTSRKRPPKMSSKSSRFREIDQNKTNFFFSIGIWWLPRVTPWANADSFLSSMWKSISRKKIGSSHQEISVSCTCKNTIMFDHLIIPFSLHYQFCRTLAFWSLIITRESFSRI